MSSTAKYCCTFVLSSIGGCTSYWVPLVSTLWPYPVLYRPCSLSSLGMSHSVVLPFTLCIPFTLFLGSWLELSWATFRRFTFCCSAFCCNKFCCFKFCRPAFCHFTFNVIALLGLRFQLLLPPPLDLRVACRILRYVLLRSLCHFYVLSHRINKESVFVDVTEVTD